MDYKAITDKLAHLWTPKRYHTERLKMLRREYPHASRAEIADVLPAHIAFDEWRALVFSAAESGQILRAIVLDRLYQEAPPAFWLLLKHNEGVLPKGYVNPGARKMGKAR